MLMSGIFSIVRELSSLYSGATPPQTLFWSLVRISFVISAFLVWAAEHNENKALRKRANQTGPRLILETTEQTARVWLQDQGWIFFLHNIGARAASFVDIEPIKSKSGNYTLMFTHPKIVAPGQRPPIQFEVLDHASPSPSTEEARSYKEMLAVFFKDCPGNPGNLLFTVTIRCRDTDSSEVTDKMKLQCEYPSLRFKVLPA